MQVPMRMPSNQTSIGESAVTLSVNDGEVNASNQSQHQRQRPESKNSPQHLSAVD